MPTYKTCDVIHNNIQHVRERATWKNNVNIVGQFERCVRYEDIGDTLCAALLDEEKDLYVGFLGLTLATEEIQSEITIFVSIEYVFLHAKVRRNGLSSYFIECAMEKVAQWIHANSQIFNGKVVQLHSASTAQSVAGSRFLRCLNERLSEEADLRGWRFV